MGAMKHAAIMEQRREILDLTTHNWHFVENRGDSLRERIDFVESCAIYANDFARTLNSVDHAVDAIENPQDYAEEIASFICAYGIADEKFVARIGFWQCDDCGDEVAIMDHEIDYAKTCRGQ